MRAIGYGRVSTDKQDNSADYQDKKIRAHAVVREDELIGVEIDRDEFSGDLNRPGLQKVLALVRARKVDAVIITKLDRLTRSTRDIAELMELFHSTGVALIDISQSLDIESAAGRLIVGFRALVAQFEREITGERTSEGLQNLKASGFAAGPAPFGYSAKKRTEEDRAKKVRHQMAPNPEEIRLGKKVNELRAARKTWRQIAAAVNHAGFRNRRGKEYSLFDMCKVWKKMNERRAA